jgi:hypothetical protein
MNNRKRSKKVMLIALSVLIILIAVVIIFFNIPYSKTKSDFKNVVAATISDEPKNEGVFTEEDIKGLPLPVQKYFSYCGYIGKPKMSYMKITFKDIAFKMSENRKMKIDYTQYNFVNKPQRFAYIDSSLYGIPFEGFDSYRDGTGSMKGVLSKLVTLFDQRSNYMDKACLVTFLSESLILPTAALQDYIRWEEIDATHAKAIITYYGISASGIFTFDENGLMLSFRTKDRYETDIDGSMKPLDWSAIILDYENVNGLRQPKTLQGVWHNPEGDNIYFNENKAPAKVEYK